MRKALDAARPELPQHLARARLDATRPLPRPLEDCAFTPPSSASLNAALDALGFVELTVGASAATKVTTCASPEDVAAALAALAGMTPSLQALLEDQDDQGREAVRGVALSAGN